MPAAETVWGDVGDLGPPLMHEHVFVVNTGYLQNHGLGWWWDGCGPWPAGRYFTP